MTSGVSARVSNARLTSRANSSPVMTPTRSSWLSRFSVRVTTLAKSSVSEVTRLTILPEGFSS